MKTFPIPGAFWVALVAALVPALAAVLAQFFPESQYWWSPVIIAGLYAVLKAVQVNVGGAHSPEQPAAAPTARGGVPNDVTAAPQPRGKTARWLLG